MSVFFTLLGVLGVIGAIFSFAFAFMFRSEAKIMKICILIGIICTVLFIIGIVATPKTSTNKNSATCPVCHKTFSYEDNEYGGYDYDNVNQIEYSNMCERCYDNYKAAQYAKDYFD